MVCLMDTPVTEMMEQIRQVRRARRKTQAHVAKHMDVSRQQYTAIEMGRSAPSVEQLRAMCRGVGVTVTIDPTGRIEVK